MSAFYSYKKWYWVVSAFLLDCLSCPLSFFIHKQKINRDTLKQNPRVLIISTGGIGDAVLLEPLIRNLKMQFTELTLDVIAPVPANEIFKLIGVDTIIEFPSSTSYLGNWLKFFKNAKRTNYDLAIDAKGDPLAILLMLRWGIKQRAAYSNGGGRYFVHTVQDARMPKARYLQHLSFLDTAESISAPQLKLQATKNNELVFHPGAGEEIKCWPEESWAKLIPALQGPISLVGTSAESQSFQVSSELRSCYSDKSGGSLIETLQIIAGARAFIGLDSGLTHAAAALGILTVCLFSLSHDPNIWAPQPARIFSFDAHNLQEKEVVAYCARL